MHIFNGEAETSAIYETLVKPLVTASLEEYNGKSCFTVAYKYNLLFISVGTIITYGQTGLSGKTFTMRGDSRNLTLTVET